MKAKIHILRTAARRFDFADEGSLLAARRLVIRPSRPCAFFITGPHGSGKTTFVNFVLERLGVHRPGSRSRFPKSSRELERVFDQGVLILDDPSRAGFSDLARYLKPLGGSYSVTMVHFRTPHGVREIPNGLLTFIVSANERLLTPDLERRTLLIKMAHGPRTSWPR